MKRLFRNYPESLKIGFLTLYFFLIILLLTPFVLNTGSISLKILGTGEQLILGENFTECPDEIYLNNHLQALDEIDCRIVNIPDGSNSENDVKLVFNRFIYNLTGMFATLTNLKEIDFSNFDSTSDGYIRSIFFKCTSLAKIKLGNLNTASVLDI